MGGGGGAPYANAVSGLDAGGGGAGYIRNVKRLAVTPGAKMTVVVGAGGAAGTSASPSASNGGSSSFGGTTANGGGAGSRQIEIGTSLLAGKPGAGSSAGGASGGAGYTYAQSMTSGYSYLYEYVSGQGSGAMNANDPGRTYGRGGRSGDNVTPTCDVDVGSGGDGGRQTTGTLQGTAGKPGGVIIYAYTDMTAMI